MTRLCVGFSHLRERKFKHNFQDTLNPLCPCSLEAEGKYHFFMHYQIFPNQRNVLFDQLNACNLEILKMSENEIVRILFFDNKSFTKHISLRTITSSITHFISTYFITLLRYYIITYIIITYYVLLKILHIFTAIKIWNIFSPSVAVFYVTYLLWRARFSFCACIVLYISLCFLSLV